MGEGQRERERKRERERERETELQTGSRLCTVSTEPYKGLEPTNLSQSQMLN